MNDITTRPLRDRLAEAIRIAEAGADLETDGILIGLSDCRKLHALFEQCEELRKVLSAARYADDPGGPQRLTRAIIQFDARSF